MTMNMISFTDELVKIAATGTGMEWLKKNKHLLGYPAAAVAGATGLSVGSQATKDWKLGRMIRQQHEDAASSTNG